MITTAMIRDAILAARSQGADTDGLIEAVSEVCRIQNERVRELLLVSDFITDEGFDFAAPEEQKLRRLHLAKKVNELR